MGAEDADRMGARAPAMTRKQKEVIAQAAHNRAVSFLTRYGIPLPPGSMIAETTCDIAVENVWARTDLGWFWFDGRAGGEPLSSRTWKLLPYGPTYLR